MRCANICAGRIRARIIPAPPLQNQAMNIRLASTNRSNEPMRRLLERQGFVASGVVENLDQGDPERVYFWISE